LKGKALGGKTFTIYEQKASGNYLALGNKLSSFKTDSAGLFQFEYPSGLYALAVNDDLGKTSIFWNVNIKSGSSYLKLNPSLITFNFNGAGTIVNPSLKLYSLSGQGGTYYQDSQLSTLKLSDNKTSLSLAAGTYLVTYTGTNNQIYGQAFYAKNGIAHTVNLAPSAQYLIKEQQKFNLSGADSNLVSGATSASVNNNQGATAVSGKIAARVKGRILLQVEDKGQAWYVNPADNRRYSLGRPEEAFNIMRQVALGVSNVDFASIEKNPSAWTRLAGRILIKPDDNGRAYYFDPTSLKLHYLGRPADAFKVMRNLGLGITNSDLNQITATN
jgi:hypothetical protein